MAEKTASKEKKPTGIKIKNPVLRKYWKFIAVIEVIAVLMIVADMKNAGDASGETLRPENGEGELSDTASWTGSDFRGTIDFDISERKLSSKEEKEYLKEAEAEIDRTLLGKNPSADSVWQKLSVSESYAGGRVEAVWEFSPDIVDVDGEIVFSKLDGKDAQVVEARAELTCGETSEAYIVPLNICYPDASTKEGFSWYVQKAVRDADEAGGDTYALPASVEGKNLSWSRRPDLRGLEFAALGLILIPVLIFGDKRMKTQKEKQHNDELTRDYAVIASKLSLFVGSGIRPREAFKRISTSYEKNRRRGAPCSAGYEEIERTVREMDGGIGENEAYLRLGDRTNHRDYRRLSLLLSQNLKKGDRFLSAELSREELDAFEIRKNRALKLGEEASTKLIFPMLLLLGTVMIVLMVPAFMGMGF